MGIIKNNKTIRTMIKTFAAALGLMAMEASAAPRLRRCPRDYSPMESLDLDRYLGTWYEIQLGCDIAEYTANDDCTITVKNSGHRPIQGWSSVEGSAVLADSGDASLIVSFSGNTPSPSDEANYTVLDTDYETYSIVYSCGNIAGLASFDFLWILAREPQLDDQKMLELIGKIEDTLPDYGFFKNSIETRQGKTCPYSKRPE